MRKQVHFTSILTFAAVFLALAMVLVTPISASTTDQVKASAITTDNATGFATIIATVDETLNAMMKTATLRDAGNMSLRTAETATAQKRNSQQADDQKMKIAKYDADMEIIATPYITQAIYVDVGKNYRLLHVAVCSLTKGAGVMTPLLI